MDYAIDKDRYVSCKYTLQHNSDDPFIKIYNLALSCNIDLALGESIVTNILDENGVTQDSNDSTMFNIIKTTKAAKIFASRDNGTLSQDMLDLANSYIETINKSLN